MNGFTKEDDDELMVEDCVNRSEKLTEWELGFIDSLQRQVSSNLGMSEKQRIRLTAIWGRVT